MPLAEINQSPENVLKCAPKNVLQIRVSKNIDKCICASMSNKLCDTPSFLLLIGPCVVSSGLGLAPGLPNCGPICLLGKRLDLRLKINK